MNVVINPLSLNGEISINASKSIMHRALICAALADGKSVLHNTYISDDITATIDILVQLGAEISIVDKDIFVTGISKDNLSDNLILDSHESGSTIRFMIPIICAMGISASFIGRNKLTTRPLAIYQDCLSKNNVTVDYNQVLPFNVSGQLLNGEFIIKGDVSSQFITGLLFALPLLNGDSTIKILPPFESVDYVNMTCNVLSDFGIDIKFNNNCYYIKGNQKYIPQEYTVEGDYSQGAFFLVANVLNANLDIKNLSPTSLQGDKAIVNILKDKFAPFNIDAGNIPDLVPILCVYASFCNDVCIINNVKRLKLKESDRIASSINLINSIGGDAKYVDDSIIITPVKNFVGGTVDSFNDHRIAMSATIAALKSTNKITIKNAKCVNKSYPDFYEDIKKLGGDLNVINVE